MLNLDPDEINDIDIVKVITITFQAWEYTKEVTVELNSDMIGTQLFELAIQKIYDELPYIGSSKYIVLNAPEGDSLHCDDDNDNLNFLNEMVIKAEIVELKNNETNK
jgi:hypothetical protein